ncbi:MAG: hypothetical protein ACRDP6_32785 [Actinoallomurus sp.]
MATENLAWRAAVEIVCCELEEHAAHRDAGRSVAETAVAMGVGSETAAQYERTITLILAALTSQAAEDAQAPPSGCRWCGLEEREHFGRWSRAAGWHGWIEPAQEQRLARMRARRAARTTSQTEAVPGPGRPETAHEAHDTEKGIAP